MAIFKGKLTKHFTIDEYQVNQTDTCYITREAIEHADMLEEFRLWLGKPMKVNAWFRTKAYNSRVGGVSNSSHLKGIATDISMPGLSKDDFIKYAKKWKAICVKYNCVGEAGLKSKSLGIVPAGTVLSGTEVTGGWLKTKYNSKSGYVRTEEQKVYCKKL